MAGPLDPDRVAAASFSTKRKGYDPDEVRGYLARVADELRRLRSAAEAKSVHAAAAPVAPAPVREEIDEHALTARLGEEAVLVLEGAREAAASVRRRTEERVEALLREASEEAASVRSAAEAARAAAIAEGERQAAALVEAATHEASAVRRRAIDEGESAQERARALLQEAQAERDEILQDLAERRRRARVRLEELRAAYDELEKGVLALKAQAEEAERVLTRARAAAADAAEGVGEPTSRRRPEAAPRPAPPAPEAPEAGSGPDDAEREPEPRPAAATPGPDPTTDRATPSPPLDLEPAGEPLFPPVPDEAEPAEPPASGAGSETKPEGLLGRTDLPLRLAEGGPLDPRPGEYLDPSGRNGSGHGGTAGPGGPEPSVAAEDDHGDEDGGDGGDHDDRVGGDAVEGLFAQLRAQREDEVAGARALLAFDTAEAGTALGDETASETGPTRETAPASGNEAASETEAAPATGDEGTMADPEPGQVEPAATGPAPAAKGGAAATPTDGRDGLFAAREALAAEARRRWARSLRRELADLENQLLSGPPPEAGSLRGLVAPWHETLARPLVELAEQAGRELCPGGPAPDGPLRLDDVVDAVLADVTANLESRIVPGDEPADPGRIRAIFREWRAERLDDVAATAVASAIVRGVVRGLPEGAPVRWLCEPGHSCPDGLDNELAGATGLGEPFPTGLAEPPVSPSCCCLLVPADR